MTYLKISKSNSASYVISIIISSLCVTHLISLLIKFNSNNSYLLGLAKLFDFNEESNIPTLFSTLLLVFCSLILWVIYSQENSSNKKSTKRPWAILSGLFALVAIDEFCAIHEKLIPVIGDVYDLPSYLKYAWVLPYSILVIVAAFFFLPFLQRLPKATRYLFYLAAVLYIGGAIGMEILGGNHHYFNGTENIQYVVYYSIEELMEMSGCAVFVYALLKYNESRAVARPNFEKRKITKRPKSSEKVDLALGFFDK